MSSVDSGFPSSSDCDLLSTAHSSSYNSFGSQNGDAVSNGGLALAALNTPSGRNSSSAASADILRMVLEEDEEEEEEEDQEEMSSSRTGSDVLTINAAVQTGGVMQRHRLWSASVLLSCLDRPTKLFLSRQMQIYPQALRDPCRVIAS